MNGIWEVRLLPMVQTLKPQAMNKEQKKQYIDTMREIHGQPKIRLRSNVQIEWLFYFWMQVERGSEDVYVDQELIECMNQNKYHGN